VTSGRAIALAAVLVGVPFSAHAQGELALTVVRPGGGFLVTDGVSTVALELRLRSAEGPVAISRARVRASLGRVRRTKVVADGRVAFQYTPPKRKVATAEMLDVSLRTKTGDNILEAFSFEVPPPDTPAVSVVLEPSVIDATRPRRVDLRAVARGTELASLELYASDGALSSKAQSRVPQGGLQMAASWNSPSNLPNDAPSHFIVLAAAAGSDGFSGQAMSISATAPLRIRAEIEPGSMFVLEGAERDPQPVRAPADGFTTIYGTVRYGARIRAFAENDGRREEVPIVVPSGMVPPGIARAIPGQNVADGGTGASVLVAVPPSPFGEEIVWPELEVEGARLVRTITLSDNLKALVLRRPKTATPVTIVADFQPIGTIEFGPGHGTGLELAPDYPRPGERGAIVATVRDPVGEPTDRPLPKARLDDGTVLSTESIGPGRFRISLPSSVKGATGSEVVVDVELPPPTVIAGDPVELVGQAMRVALEGPPPAIKPKQRESVARIEKPKPKEEETGIGFDIGLSASGHGGAAVIGGMSAFGGGVHADLRPPVWENRLGAKVGFEYSFAGKAGNVQFGDDQLASKMEVSGVVIPIELGVSAVKSDIFELTVRGGLELRFMAAVLDVGGETFSGGSSFGVGGRGGLEGAFTIGPGAVFVGVTATGLGANADALTGEDAMLTGNLIVIRADLGFRVWL